MPERAPMTQTMKASEARQHFSQLLNKVFRKETRIVVEKSGIPVAAIVSAQDLEQLQVLEAEREARFAVLDRIRARNADQDPDEVLRDVTAVVEDVRQEADARARAAEGRR